MKSMRTKQGGITFIGLLLVFGFIALVVLFVLRAFPLYNERMQVMSAMNNVASRPDATKLSTKDVRRYFLRNIEATTNILIFTDQSVKELVKVVKPKKKGEPRLLQVTYQSKNKLVHKLQLLMEFDEKVPLRGPGEGE